jgi:hypothetical protein
LVFTEKGYFQQSASIAHAPELWVLEKLKRKKKEAIDN